MLTPATITVNFTANYAGPHRICWRQCGVGSYVCTNIVDCAGGGNACSATISVMVNPESCDPVCFEGYIQATCNPEGSSVGQVPWTTTFTPDPVCKMYSLTCTNVCIYPPPLCVGISAGTMGLNCNGTARPDVQLFCGTPIYLCATGVIPNLPLDYTMRLTDKCCYTCTQYDVVVSATGGPLDGSMIYYTECGTRELKRLDLIGAGPFTTTICAVTDSVSLQLNALSGGSVTAKGSCS